MKLNYIFEERLKNSFVAKINDKERILEDVFNVRITDANDWNDIIDDMLFISCRDAKLINASELMNQMDNWVNVVSKRGYPYKFTNIGQFNNFKNELKSGLSNLGVSVSDVRIQGSSLRTPNANDVDMVAIISEIEFDDILKKAYNGKIQKNGLNIDISNMSNQQLKDLAEDIFNNKSLYSKEARENFMYNVRSQMINAKPDKGVIIGLKELKNGLQVKYPNLNIENISIQSGNSPFDLKPFMKL